MHSHFSDCKSLTVLINVVEAHLLKGFEHLVTNDPYVVLEYKGQV